MSAYKKVCISAVRTVSCVDDELDPATLPTGAFLLKALYSLVSAGTETACYRGQEAWFPLPGVPGYSCVGQVLAAAEDVTDVAPGDLVFCRGKHAGLQFIHKEENYCKLPQGMNLKHAPIARMFAIALTAVRQSAIELGDDVLVIGLGLIGNAAAQLAALQGGNVLAMDLDDSRLDIARACGIAHTLNSGRLDDPMAAISEVFQGRKPSTVIDATGIPKVIDQAIDYVAQDGRLILLGSPRGSCIGELSHFQQHIHRFPYRVEVVGAHEQTVPNKATPYVKHSCQRNERICLELIAQGRLKVEPLITNIVPPTEAATVYRELDKGNPAYLGVLFDWTEQGG